MKWIIATNNMHKMEEFRRILSPFGIEAISQREAGIDLEVEETADSFAGNSLLKARAIHRISAGCVLADDSGLEVFALDHAPGVYSARYGGPGLDDKARTALLLKNMQGIPEENRGARFVCCITMIDEAGESFSFTGYCEGRIGYEPKGENGFGYDPVFMVGDKSFSQLSPEEKDAVSHRGKAMRLLEEKIKSDMQKRGIIHAD